MRWSTTAACAVDHPISEQEPFEDPTGSVLYRAANGVRNRSGFAITTSGRMAIELSHGCVADCPSAPCVPKHLAAFFHALQRRFRSLGEVIDGLGNLGCCHCLAGKRQFAQDQFAYLPTDTSPARLVRIRCGSAGCGNIGCGSVGCGIAGRNCRAEHFHGRSKTFLAGFDQPGFLGFLFAQRERRPSVSLQRVQIRPNSLN
jgi:hypothetical protein